MTDETPTRGKPKELGFLIAGERYEIPDAYRLGDPILIAELSGLEFVEWARKLETLGWTRDPSVIIGLVGVALWQRNPSWSRQRVKRETELVAQGSFEWDWPDLPVGAVPNQPGSTEEPSPSAEPSDRSTNSLEPSAEPDPD